MPSHSHSLIGVSPEFEVALFTLCFLNGNEDNVIVLGPYRCNIKCYKFSHGSNVKIGTVFPEAVSMTVNEAATVIQAHARGHLTRSHANNVCRAPPRVPSHGYPSKPRSGNK